MRCLDCGSALFKASLVDACREFTTLSMEGLKTRTLNSTKSPYAPPVITKFQLSKHMAEHALRVALISIKLTEVQLFSLPFTRQWVHLTAREPLKNPLPAALPQLMQGLECGSPLPFTLYWTDDGCLLARATLLMSLALNHGCALMLKVLKKTSLNGDYAWSLGTIIVQKGLVQADLHFLFWWPS